MEKRLSSSSARHLQSARGAVGLDIKSLFRAIENLLRATATITVCLIDDDLDGARRVDQVVGMDGSIPLDPIRSKEGEGERTILYAKWTGGLRFGFGSMGARTSHTSSALARLQTWLANLGHLLGR